MPWRVPLGRRDGRVSLRQNVINLPSFSINASIPDLLNSFRALGFSMEEFVALVGGHTIGTASCGLTADGSCPGLLQRVALDTGSQFAFDNSIFSNILNDRGVLYVDQSLSLSDITRPVVELFVNDKDAFNTEFERAMIKMSNIGLKTFPNGEIRRRCSAINQMSNITLINNAGD
ncbi:unnamed protein product [Thlaspi arvense]|uniref:peroxidase n=1 Tax=Thlaspi arvense TaxID=13288 RepID=A0AAU9SV70_THLAR|nr:unnamed protein product [Thlaspi arvense]